MEQVSDEPEAQTYPEEIETAIVGLVITLCNQKSLSIGMDAAKREVINLLERIVTGLATSNETDKG